MKRIHKLMTIAAVLGLSGAFTGLFRAPVPPKGKTEQDRARIAAAEAKRARIIERNKRLAGDE